MRIRVLVGSIIVSVISLIVIENTCRVLCFLLDSTTMKYQTRVKWYTLPERDQPVKPVNGEKWKPAHPSWSAGFTHMIHKDGTPAGFCGQEWFEENAELVTD